MMRLYGHLVYTVHFEDFSPGRMKASSPQSGILNKKAKPEEQAEIKLFLSINNSP